MLLRILALKKRPPDKTFYLAYDMNKRDNLYYHHPEYYPFDFQSEGYKLVSGQINNISLKVLMYTPILPTHIEIIFAINEI